MGAAEKLRLVSVEDYLAGESGSPVKHEYLAGAVYAMAGSRIAHNIIAGNVHGSLFGKLRGQKCRPYNSDTKVRISFRGQTRFYYPDCSVVCHSSPQDSSFQTDPDVLLEVLSRRTRRIDEGEKKDAYLTLPSLRAYVLIEQETAAAVVFRRNDTGWEREVYAGMDAIIPLGEIGTDLPLAEIYDGVEFSSELDDHAE